MAPAMEIRGNRTRIRAQDLDSAAEISRRISCDLSSLHSPGRSFPSGIGPIASRLRRVIFRPQASNILRNCLFFPSPRIISYRAPVVPWRNNRTRRARSNSPS